MKMFSILDGAQAFRQWDVGQKLAVADERCREVHFCNADSQQALVCEVYTQQEELFVNVPNILLQQPQPMQVYGYAKMENSGRTVYAQTFAVLPRQKPEDYVYTETEVKSYEALESRIQKLEEKASGDFDGEDHVLTDADKAEIAQQAAVLVDTALLDAIGTGEVTV